MICGAGQGQGDDVAHGRQELRRGPNPGHVDRGPVRLQDVGGERGVDVVEAVTVPAT
jgi:hypothetical protein